MPRSKAREEMRTCGVALLLFLPLLNAFRTGAAAEPLGRDVSTQTASPACPQALRMADFILSLQDASGAIVDEPGGSRVNEDSNMEYALIGLGAAYSASKNPKYLQGMESGIRWLGAREEMQDPVWKGSWYLAYSAKTGRPAPVDSGPGYSDARGVDATSALFVYLLYLDQRLSGTGNLASALASQGHAALDFVIQHNLAPDGFSRSSWLHSERDGHWELFTERYSADQGDVYLGMHAGEILYRNRRYAKIAAFLRSATPARMFDAKEQRYALGMDDRGQLSTEDDGNSAAFSQGYLTWMWGDTKENRAAAGWLRAKVQPNGAIVTMPVKPGFSLNAAMLGIADAGLSTPTPAASLRWLFANTFDPETGGVHHSTDPHDAIESTNEAGFCIIACLRFLPFA